MGHLRGQNNPRQAHVHVVMPNTAETEEHYETQLRIICGSSRGLSRFMDAVNKEIS